MKWLLTASVLVLSQFASAYEITRDDLIIYWLASNDPSEGVSLGHSIAGEAFEIELKGCQEWEVQKNTFYCINSKVKKAIGVVPDETKEISGDLAYPAFYRKLILLKSVKASFDLVDLHNTGYKTWVVTIK